MSKYSALIKRASSATAALALTVASLTPAVMLGGSAEAAQILNRSITMANSAPNASNNWVVKVDDAYASQTFTLAVCDSPIFDVTCANPEDGATGVGADSYNGTFGAASGGYASATVPAVNPDGVDGNNISGDVGTFYVRITSQNGDTGAVALSTTNELNITAYVVEQLTFCVGADDSPTNLDGTGAQDACTDLDGSTVDLGVVGTTIKETPQPYSTTNLGNDKEGALLIQTNAVNGVNISYFSDGQMRAGGVSCTATVSANDLCFNNAVTTLANATEEFGMYKVAVTNTGSTDVEATWNMTDNDYSTDSFYKWNGSTTPESIMSSTGAVDWDVIQLRFGIAASAITPSGAYSTNATFIATGEF